jgi:hypothetical protein
VGGGDRYYVSRFTAREVPGCPLHKRLGGLQSLSGRFGIQKNLSPTSGIEPRFLGNESRGLATILTELVGSGAHEMFLKLTFGWSVIVWY